MNNALSVQINLQEAWMQIENPNLTIEQAIVKLKELGNSIIKVDKKNRRILVAEGQ